MGLGPDSLRELSNERRIQNVDALEVEDAELGLSPDEIASLRRDRVL
ncbi:MAG: hypothetical protein JO020_09565 [Chloroflexi bacterium]|nr:hypothetical protein [Chloroflexota bacterium]MBV9132152.1 hypothetical protein [Chloroflexota bacterium]MBV9894406.1 hypothetical protein [Chloroflexota bacterium]